VVGSALIDQIAGAKSPEAAVEGVLGLCRAISAGVHGARG
jgi:tryptophan synthase alpha chain